MPSLTETCSIGPVSQSSSGFAQSAIEIVAQSTACASNGDAIDSIAAKSSAVLFFAKALMELIDATGRAHGASARAVGVTLIDCGHELDLKSMGALLRLREPTNEIVGT
jgi:hypothetical protein